MKNYKHFRFSNISLVSLYKLPFAHLFPFKGLVLIVITAGFDVSM